MEKEDKEEEKQETVVDADDVKDEQAANVNRNDRRAAAQREAADDAVVDWRRARKMDLSGGRGGRGGETTYTARNGTTVESSIKTYVMSRELIATKKNKPK